jgi:hypothetical protein
MTHFRSHVLEIMHKSMHGVGEPLRNQVSVRYHGVCMEMNLGRAHHDEAVRLGKLFENLRRYPRPHEPARAMKP